MALKEPAEISLALRKGWGRVTEQYAKEYEWAEDVRELPRLLPLAIISLLRSCAIELGFLPWAM